MSVTVNGTSGLVFGDGTIQGTAAGMAFRNRIINGDMRIDQRNNGAAVNVVSAYAYPVDRIRSYNASSARWTVQRVTDAPAGFTYSAKITVTTPQSSYSSSELSQLLETPIEGYNIADLAWGTASAKTVTISFWVKSSITGSHGLSVFSLTGGNQRTYNALYTISAANTWEYKTITIPGDTSGSWNNTNGAGMYVAFVGKGSPANTGVVGWQSGFLPSVSSAVNVLATNGATFQVTGLQLEKASAATDYEQRPYATEMAMCQRYCVLHGTLSGGYTLTLARGMTAGGSIWRAAVHNVVPMRATPSLTGVNLEGWNSSSGSIALTGIGTVYSLNGLDVEFDCSLASSFGTSAFCGFVQTKGTGGASYLLAEAEL